MKEPKIVIHLNSTVAYDLRQKVFGMHPISVPFHTILQSIDELNVNDKIIQAKYDSQVNNSYLMLTIGYVLILDIKGLRRKYTK